MLEEQFQQSFTQQESFSFTHSSTERKIFLLFLPASLREIQGNKISWTHQLSVRYEFNYSSHEICSFSHEDAIDK